MIFSPRFVRGIVGTIFPDLRKTQKVNLGLAVFGQILSQSTVLSEIVRRFPGDFKHKHKLKRLFRFVSNPRVKPERLMDLWTGWCIRRFTPGRYLSVALDWTTLPGNRPALMASLLLSGRAVPLLWQMCDYSQIKDSTNRIEQRLISRLVNLLPSGKRLVLLADRGFGRAELFRFLLAKNILFAIRVAQKVRVTPVKGKAFLLSTLAKKLKPELPVWHERISYRDDQVVSGLNLAAVVAKGSTDPWLVVTNLRSCPRTISTYATRFHIEEGFKDMKHAVGFAGIRTHDSRRIRRLLLVTAVSQGLLMLVGRLAWRLKTVKQRLISGGNQVCSRIWLAIEAIRYRLLLQPFWTRVRQVALGP